MESASAPPMRWGAAVGLSLAAVLGFLAVTWDAYDVDEFVNLQQALAVRAGLSLYDDAPSNHPPGYTLILAVASVLPGPMLLGPRLASALMLWSAGLMVADLYRRRGKETHAVVFLGVWVANSLLLLHATRATNEVPVLFFACLAAYLLLRQDLRSGWADVAAGAALACAFMVRYTAAWYAPAFLLAGPRRVLRMALGGGLVALAAVVWWLIGEPFTFDGLWNQTVAYHQGRTPQSFWFRFGMIALGTGTPLALVAHWALPGFWKGLGKWRIPMLVATLGVWGFLFLPVTWMHYMLPFSPLVAVGVTEAVLWRPSRPLPHLVRRKAAVAGTYVVVAAVTCTSLMVWDFMPDLSEIEPVAAHLDDVAPAGAPILTDHAELALFAERENWGNYYWTVRDHPDWPADAAADVAMVASRRVPERGLPADVLEATKEWPCATMNSVTLRWNPAYGAPPAGYGSGCPDMTPSGIDVAVPITR